MKVSSVGFYLCFEKEQNDTNFECFINYLFTGIIIVTWVMLERFDLRCKRPMHHNNFNESKFDDWRKNKYVEIDGLCLCAKQVKMPPRSIYKNLPSLKWSKNIPYLWNVGSRWKWKTPAYVASFFCAQRQAMIRWLRFHRLAMLASDRKED